MTPKEKITAIQNTEEIKNAIALLYATFKDLDLQSYIRLNYDIDGEEFEITFMRILNR